VDEVVAAAVEEIATGITAATDLLFAPFPNSMAVLVGRSSGSLGRGV